MTVCDLCIYEIPSSCDGKPCTMCPAETNIEIKTIPLSVLDKIRAEIDAHREKLKILADDDWYAGKIRGYDCAIEIIDKYKAESEETETWNGIHAQITAPKGTFDKLWEDAKAESEE